MPLQPEDEISGWIIFQYVPITLFSLKASRATSTAGKTLVTPTPYAVKMAFLDAGLRNGFVKDSDLVVRSLAGASIRIGLPEHACVTGTIQSVRQETREAERKSDPATPPYRASIAMREFVHYQGRLRLAFDLKTCGRELTELLLQVAPVIQYLGKRGSFIQYLGVVQQTDLDATFTQTLKSGDAPSSEMGQRAALDDFGTGASFDALNSFSAAAVKIGVHRIFVETMVPLAIYNAGPGFVHYLRLGEL